MKNILFDEKPTPHKVKATADNTPICPITNQPMQKVICGSFKGKKIYAWFSREARLALPIFKTEV